MNAYDAVMSGEFSEEEIILKMESCGIPVDLHCFCDDDEALDAALNILDEFGEQGLLYIIGCCPVPKAPPGPSQQGRVAPRASTRAGLVSARNRGGRRLHPADPRAALLFPTRR